MRQPDSGGSNLILPILGEGSVVAVIQFIPMVLLSLLDYAWYGAIYLVYAALLAGMFASLSDVWARSVRQGATGSRDRDAYYAVLTGIAVVVGATIGVTTGLLALEPSEVVAAAMGAGSGIYRMGSRYYALAVLNPKRVGKADLLGAFLGVMLCTVVLVADRYSLTAAFAIWAVVNFTHILATKARPVLSWAMISIWVTRHRRTIRALLTEAGIMNLSSMGTPYIAGIVLGAPGLTLLRSAASLAYPVRLVLGVMRSRVMSGVVSGGVGVLLMVTLSGIVLAGLIGGALTVVERNSIAPESALALAAEHIGAIALLIFGTTLSTFLQFSARGALGRRDLIMRRIVHAMMMLTGTVVGAVGNDLTGAIWGVALTTTLTSAVWLNRKAGHTRPMRMGIGGAR